MAQSFPLAHFLDVPRTLSLEEIDWTRATAHPLAADVEEALVHMLRVDGQTLFFVRDVLNTPTAYNSDVSAFFSAWLYEKERHTRTVRRFLKQRDVDIPEDELAQSRLVAARRISNWAEATAERWIARATPHFIAMHMVWGAMQEITSAFAYKRIADRCEHPFLRELCLQIEEAQRAHLLFFENQSRIFLQSKGAQALVRTMALRWKTPVGLATGPSARRMVAWFYGGEEGRATLAGMDAIVDAMPGLQGLHVFARSYERAFKGRGVGLLGLASL